MGEIKKFITEILVEHFYIQESEIDWNEKIEYVPLDDLDTVELLMKIEQHYQISIPDEVCEEFESLNEVINYVSAARGVVENFAHELAKEPHTEALNKHNVMPSLPLDESGKWDEHGLCKTCGAVKPF